MPPPNKATFQHIFIGYKYIYIKPTRNLSFKHHSFLAISGTERSKLHRGLGSHHLGRSICGEINALSFLLLELFLDPESLAFKTRTFNLIVGAQPSFSLMRVLSEFLPRTPSGPGMCSRPFNAINPGSFHHVEADHCVVVHNNRVIRLNEPHSTHISSKVEDMVNSLSDLQTIVHNPQINEMKLMTEHVLSHVLVFLPVRSNNVVALTLQPASNVRSNKPSSPSNGDAELLRWPVRLPLKVLIGVSTIINSSRASHPKPLQ
nr:hypothetical protein T12_3427 [Ipomoea batatas]